jgi:hypothetical protein
MRPFHDLRVTHETSLLDDGVPVHVVAARCDHDPAVLLRVYAKRTRKADQTAAAAVGRLSQSILTDRDQVALNIGPVRTTLPMRSHRAIG